MLINVKNGLYFNIIFTLKGGLIKFAIDIGYIIFLWIFGNSIHAMSLKMSIICKLPIKNPISVPFKKWNKVIIRERNSGTYLKSIEFTVECW